MPREDRWIFFDFTETYKAIFTLCMQNELPRPFAGSITAVNFKADDDRCVVVRFANGLQGTSATSEYSRDFLAAALIAVLPDLQYSDPEKSHEIGGTGR